MISLPHLLRHTLVGGFCLFLSAVSGAQAANSTEDIALGRQQDALYRLEIHDAVGNRLDLKHHPGKLLIINFWAYWCPHCLEEMAGFKKLQSDLGPDCVFVVLVSSPDDWVKDQAYAIQHKIPFPRYVWTRTDTTTQAAAFLGRVQGNAVAHPLPMTAIFLPTGKLLSGHIGALDWTNPKLENDLKDVVELNR